MPIFENIEFQNFYISLQEEVKARLIASEEGTTTEEEFTAFALEMLSDSGETENYRLSYDEKVNRRGVEHKINAYAISENYETLDLFITLFYGTDKIQSIQKADVDKAIERLLKFFKNSVYKDYVSSLEPSSEIFDLAHTIANASEIKEFLTRVNIFLLTDGEIKNELKISEKISDYTVYFRIIDINYLFNLSEKSHIPIEINFEDDDFEVPCLISPSENEYYQSYLAIMPGKLLASIYEKFGSRLLEQNVRSFLQFSGKINKGIRTTIMKEPHMFLAFNNGIAATAESIKIELSKSGKGYLIKNIKDLQIVNGGQTTASIFHTLKKDRADISGIYVQLKLTIVKDKTNFSQMVSRISEYANTQNKVSISDLSSNNPSFIELEKLSRLIFAPHVSGNIGQTRWFFERARGQYKNERAREGRTKAKLRAFDAQNPRKQLFTKEDLAKYVNSYSEVVRSNKILIGPHIVVKGSQKNHKAFVDYNLPAEIDNIYYEDVVAKSILFRTAEKIYGVKPDAIGDLRFITVPYTISYLVYSLKNPIDLYKIWKEQEISEGMQHFLKTLMIKVEGFIKKHAPGSLYGEWAKKEVCWDALKNSRIVFDISQIENDIMDIKKSRVRKKMNKEQIDFMEEEYQFEKIKSISIDTWKRIKEWGKETNILNLAHLDRIHNYLLKQSREIAITNEEGYNLIEIVETVSKKAPEILIESEIEAKTEEDLLKEKAGKMVEWIKEKKHSLEPDRFTFLKDVQKGRKTFSLENKTTLTALVKYLKQYGYNDN